MKYVSKYTDHADVVEDLTISVNDGYGYGEAADVSINIRGVNHIATQKATLPQSVVSNQEISLSSMFSVSDVDGDAITQYRITDPNGLGSINLNGAKNLSTTSGQYVIGADDLERLTYLGANGNPLSNNTEALKIASNDGKAWSNDLNVNVKNVGSFNQLNTDIKSVVASNIIGDMSGLVADMKSAIQDVVQYNQAYDYKTPDDSAGKKVVVKTFFNVVSSAVDSVVSGLSSFIGGGDVKNLHMMATTDSTMSYGGQTIKNTSTKGSMVMFGTMG